MPDAVAKREAAKLATFTTFLNAASPAGHAGGLIGEWGIPQADPTAHPNAQYVTDVANWQKAVEWVWTQIDDYNAANAPGKTVWATTWADGPAWGEYNLGGLVGDAPGPITKARSPGIIDVREAHPPQQAGVRYGGNVAGMDFGGGNDNPAYSNANPGVFNTDYYAPVAADAAYLASRNVGVVRLPVLWERLQPTPLGALDATYLGRISTFVSACQAQGIEVILDLHNYGRYCYDLGGGTRRVLKVRVGSGLSTTADGSGEGRVGSEYLADVWRRLSSQYKTSPTGRYDLPHEPHDLGGDSTAAFGVIGADDAATPAARTTAAANGTTHILVRAYWDRLQPTSAGQAVDATEIANLASVLTDAQGKGLKVLLSLELQYPPAWAQTAIPKFRKQDNATEWSAAQASGDNVRDWMWTQTGRTAVSDFVRKTLAALDLTKVDAVKLGGGIKGELQFPSVGGAAPYAFWGYGAAQQNGADLATGMTRCPAAVRYPFVPFAAGNAAADNTTWTNWWLDGLKTWMLWLIGEHRAGGWDGLVYVQHPSFGLRSNWTQADATYQEAVAQGQDWDRLLAAYQSDRTVWPYSTWMDQVDPFTPITADSDKAAWRKLYELAQARGKHYLIWGENTGGQTNADMDRVFQAGAVALGYRGVVWLDHTSLNDGATDTYANWNSRIAAYNAGAFSGTTMYPWATTTQGWAVDGGGASGTLAYSGAEGHAAAGALQVTRLNAAAGFLNTEVDDAGQKLGDPGNGQVLSAWVKLAAGTTGTWTASVKWQNSAFTWKYGPAATYYDTAGNQVSGLIAGQWVNVRTDHTADPITTPNAYGVRLQSNNAPAANVVSYVDDFARGSVSSAVTLDGQRTWEIVTQRLLNAIRANGDTHEVIVPGYGWNIASWPHSAPWIVEPGSATHRYATHLYHDPDDSGDYSVTTETYAQTKTAAVGAGYADDADATAPVISALSPGTPTANGTTITWTTGEAADRRVVYRTAAQATWFKTTTRGTGLATSHAVPLSGLAPGTTYTYQVRSRDAAGNLATQTGTFTTVATSSPRRPGGRRAGSRGPQDF